MDKEEIKDSHIEEGKDMQLEKKEVDQQTMSEKERKLLISEAAKAIFKQYDDTFKKLSKN